MKKLLMSLAYALTMLAAEGVAIYGWARLGNVVAPYVATDLKLFTGFVMYIGGTGSILVIAMCVVEIWWKQQAVKP